MSALCETSRGVCVNLESCWSMPDALFGNIDFDLQVIGEEGAVQAALFPQDLRLHTHGSAGAVDYSMEVNLPGRVTGWWEESVISFLRAVRDGLSVEPDAAEGREVTRTLLAIDRSLEEGATVQVGDIR